VVSREGRCTSSFRPPSDPPDFVERSALLGRAYRFARAAHGGSRSRDDTTIDHPVAVASIVREHASDEVVAAALLHDVLEATTFTRQELEDQFGARIAGLVAQLSEDAAIEDYMERKARLRAEVANAGEDAALIFLADKLARLEALDETQAGIEPPRLAHYRDTLELLSNAYPELPLIPDLRHALRNAARKSGSDQVD
jgi:(p)ppGpp synthase/HD superfamily hydrolase